jgi:hypothetical protein
MIKPLLILFLLLSPILSMAQGDGSPIKPPPADTLKKTDLIDIFRGIIHIEKRPPSDKRKIYFSILPISSSGVNSGKALITSTTAGFYLGDPKTTNISSVNFAPYLNFHGRYGLPIHSSIWLKDNSYTIQGDTRYLVYPQYTWGLGGGQSNDDKFLVDYKYIRFYQSVLKKIKPYFFAGIGYNLDYYVDIGTDNGNAKTFRQFTGYQFGTNPTENTFSAGPSVNLLYDTRNNSINPLPGYYANIIYRYSTTVLGSSNAWQTLYLDARKYLSLTEESKRKNMLAFWGYYWTSLSSGTPYLSLPAIGMDPNQRSGRGIDQNRYRGNSLIYFETEYRRDLTDNGLFGFVVFGNINSASQPNSRQFRYWNPAMGAGLRIKFNKNSGTNIGIDYGVSKGYSSLSFNLGEAF